MRETPTTENIRDFKQRYEGTFGWFLSEKGTKHLVKVQAVGNGSVVFYDLEGNKYTAAVNGGGVFEFIPISKGWVNSKNGNTYLMTRIPARQWSRGICSSNTNISCFGEQETSYGRAPGFFAVYTDLDVLSNIFINIEETVTSINNFLAGKRVSVALSKHFMLSNKFVYMYDKMVGQYKEKQITLSSPLFYQEMLDVIRRNNLEIRVNV